CSRRAVPRRSAAEPIPPALLALRVFSANADSVSGNLHTFSSPAPNPQMLALQLRRSQNRILAILARRIFAHQELVSVHGRLIVSASKTVAHLGVKFRNGQQGI